MATGEEVLQESIKEDEILKIFFDESFVPQAFVDILLSNAADRGIDQVQSISSSLLGRLDYYTKHLTKKLESTIGELENLSETLPGTWAVSVDKGANSDDYSSSSKKTGGSSKLEYYLDTLGSAVRALEMDVTKIDRQLEQLSLKYEESQCPVEKLQNLRKIKERLLKVSQNFNTLRVILDISSGSAVKEPTTQQSHISLYDFELSLNTLEDTICQSLTKTSNEESPSETNRALLKRIEVFTELKPLFKGLDKFYPIYSEFSENIKIASQNYLNSKDIEDELGI